MAGRRRASQMLSSLLLLIESVLRRQIRRGDNYPNETHFSGPHKSPLAGPRKGSSLWVPRSFAVVLRRLRRCYITDT